MNMNNVKIPWFVSLLSLLLAIGGCTVHPPGELEERNAAMRAEKPFQKPFENREITALANNPTPDELVQYALLSNAELEQRFWEWRAAIEQVPQDGTQTTTLNVSLGTAITNGRAGWGSSTVALSNDPMTDIKWPGKLDAAAKQSLENAKAAGERFQKAKYEIREKVLIAYYDYALNAELIRLEQSDQQLLESTATITDARNRAGSSGQEDVLKAKNEVDLSKNDIANMESQLPGQRAALNALLSRPADAPLPVPTELPPINSVKYSDQQFIELAAKRNPELAALADEIRGRADGIRLAKLQYIPDFNLSTGTDLMGVTQSILGQATIPILRHEALDAAIFQAEADMKASEAMRRQTRNDLAAQVIVDLSTFRDADRQLDLLEHAVLPRAEEMITVARSAYVAGQSSFLDLLDSERSLLAIERMIAQLRAARGKTLADLEAIAAVRLEGQPSRNE
jgi:cobalt-zinc-cadmium efflux system outer membrane protein